MLTVLGGLAEFERELIRIRTGEGRARAKGERAKPRPKAQAHPAPAARGDPAPRPRRIDPVDCPQLQCQSEHDFPPDRVTDDERICSERMGGRGYHGRKLLVASVARARCTANSF
jgi:hypothetical protein